MSCCCSEGSSDSVVICPQCGISSKNISMKTIFHQVKFPDVLDIETDNYYYCADQSCSVGYFTQQEKIIAKQQLKVFIGQNSRLCYCFDISTEHYVNSLKAGTAEKIKNFVIQKTKLGDCACEIRNPSGQCCLANFKPLDKAFNKAVNK